VKKPREQELVISLANLGPSGMDIFVLCLHKGMHNKVCKSALLARHKPMHGMCMCIDKHIHNLTFFFGASGST
jgi:hypothetical protein